MYQQLQDLLTLAIEAIAIIGYGGLLAHYIFTSTSAEQPAKSNLSVNQVKEETKLGIINTKNLATKVVDTTNTRLPELQQIDQLTLRQCRAVIRSLNTTLPKSDRIRLKINGKDAPTAWLRLQIKKHLEDKQEQIIPIIEQISQAS
ncbi:hypothetical protein [Floridanema evergladense]|uniref:ATP synthase protein MI25 n=1 Tax=Floridaenema evergladense BLCC-F167 TaxID=3153639 RepID=A0ABV4WNY7_9CYAN